MVKKAKMTVYCCGMFLDSILSKRAEFSICRSNFSQGPYSNSIHTLVMISHGVYCIFWQSKEYLICGHANFSLLPYTKIIFNLWMCAFFVPFTA